MTERPTYTVPQFSRILLPLPSKHRTAVERLTNANDTDAIRTFQRVVTFSLSRSQYISASSFTCRSPYLFFLFFKLETPDRVNSRGTPANQNLSSRPFKALPRQNGLIYFDSETIKFLPNTPPHRPSQIPRSPSLYPAALFAQHKSHLHSYG